MKLEGVVRNCRTFGGDKHTQFRIVGTDKSVFDVPLPIPINNDNYVIGTLLDLEGQYSVMRVAFLDIYDKKGGNLLHTYDCSRCFCQDIDEAIKNL